MFEFIFVFVFFICVLFPIGPIKIRPTSRNASPNKTANRRPIRSAISCMKLTKLQLTPPAGPTSFLSLTWLSLFSMQLHGFCACISPQGPSPKLSSSSTYYSMGNRLPKKPALLGPQAPTGQLAFFLSFSPRVRARMPSSRLASSFATADKLHVQQNSCCQVPCKPQTQQPTCSHT